VCVGSFLLAAAGLSTGDALDACAIAGHTSPQGDGEPDAIFVRDGAIWSSAGVTTGIDLALALIEQ
jgi:transcriptional regulator GlxA family with amidase domain